VPDAPVGSLEEMLELGLNHEALIPILERSTAPTARETDAYREALAKREPLRRAVVALMDAQALDVLVYPTIRTVASIVGEPQRGSNCQLSASTGLPAISLPAGWSSGVPVGMELLGRAFADADLVALAYAFEQASDLRRPPAATPALVRDAAPEPRSATVRVAGQGRDAHEVVARFDYDPVLGTLAWDVVVSGAAAPDVHAVVLRHREADGAAVVARLTGPGITAGRGTLELDDEMRARLEDGELEMVAVTRARPLGGGGVQVLLAGGSQ
jgi:hypothetical protein